MLVLSSTLSSHINFVYLLDHALSSSIVEMVCGRGRQYTGFTVQYDAVADSPRIIGNLRVALDLDSEKFQS